MHTSFFHRHRQVKSVSFTSGEGHRQQFLLSGPGFLDEGGEGWRYDAEGVAGRKDDDVTQDTTPGQRFSTCALRSSMTSNPRRVSLSGCPNLLCQHDRGIAPLQKQLSPSEGHT